jgi:hypothetical protein
MPGNQFDYSVCTGDRAYVRAFDVAFSASTTPVTANGQPFAVLRIDGMELEDFAYAAPGPGSVNGVAILVKVPGLTTWMDLGRNDGAGPSKQDPVQDGAGCKVVGPYTYNGIDQDTGVAYAQVKINVGPTANFAIGDGSEVPLLVKVVMRDPAAWGGPYDPTYYDFNHESDGTGGFNAGTGCGIQSQYVRGIVGIRVVHPDDVDPVGG